jgi:phosphoglycolate phosphatase
MHLIFDFDGTLVNSFSNVIEKFNVLAEEFKFRQIKQEDIPLLRSLNSRALIRYLKIPLYKLPKVIRKARQFMHDDIRMLTSFANMPEVLGLLCDAGFSLGILTSNSRENVTTWLTHHKLRHLFDFIHIESSFFGKKRTLKRILQRYQIKKTDAFYIGDETRDIEAAKKCGISSIAVSWGFNSEATLMSTAPDYLAREPGELLMIMGVR